MTIKVHSEPLAVRLAYLIGKRCIRDNDKAHFVVTGVTCDKGHFILYRAYDLKTSAPTGRGWRLEYEDFLTSHSRFREDWG